MDSTVDDGEEHLMQSSGSAEGPHRSNDVAGAVASEEVPAVDGDDGDDDDGPCARKRPIIRKVLPKSADGGGDDESPTPAASSSAGSPPRCRQKKRAPSSGARGGGSAAAPTDGASGNEDDDGDHDDDDEDDAKWQQRIKRKKADPLEDPGRSSGSPASPGSDQSRDGPSLPDPDLDDDFAAAVGPSAAVSSPSSSPSSTSSSSSSSLTSSSSTSSSSSSSSSSPVARNLGSSLLPTTSSSSSDFDEGGLVPDDGPRVRRRVPDDVADDDEGPRPAVLSKPAPKSKYSSFKDIVQRQYDSRRPECYFTRRRIGSLGLVKALKVQARLTGHKGCVNSLHFNSSGTLLASGSDDLKIILWDWQGKRGVGRPKLTFKSGHVSNIFQSKFLPLLGDTHLVSTSRDGQVRLALLSSGSDVCKSTKKLAQHRGAANKVALLHQSPHTFISCGEDGDLINIDVREGTRSTLLTQRSPQTDRVIAIYMVSANPVNDSYIVTAGRDSYVRVYDRRVASQERPLPLKKFCPHPLLNNTSGGDRTTTTSVSACVWNYDGNELLASYNDDDIYLFDANHSDGADSVKRFEGHRNSATVKGVQFYGPKSEYVISGSDCGNVFIWDKDTEGIVWMARGDHHGAVNVLEPHPHLPYLATSGLDSDVKIWFPEMPRGDGDDPEARMRKQIEKEVVRNYRERRMQSEEPDFPDNQILWAMLRHLRSERRRLVRMAARSANDEDDDDDEDPADQLFGLALASQMSNYDNDDDHDDDDEATNSDNDDW